ncbi:hypothetical protein SGRA_0180 [Saprospira grandis str. Lewin]|uniref:Uncharacterized protein n=1 Tax=Saprospira grandis (strain Lewin) TaxID=984262 RepID=H6L549_SAPGL|nr:hypothetical protein SGRA_0180 [Saprospira grandis str. Lewin]
MAEGQTELFERSEKSEGPSRPASPETARPERSEWAAPKQQSEWSGFYFYKREKTAELEFFLMNKR